MRLPTQKKILREDLKDAPPWVNPLIDTLNTFMENVYQALNRNITYGDNINSQIKELQYRTTASYPSAQEPLEFQSTLKTKPIGVQALQVYEKSTYTAPPGPVYIPWVEQNGQIIISTITGLEADKTYVIRFLVT